MLLWNTIILYQVYWYSVQYVDCNPGTVMKYTRNIMDTVVHPSGIPQETLYTWQAQCPSCQLQNIIYPKHCLICFVQSCLMYSWPGIVAQIIFSLSLPWVPLFVSCRINAESDELPAVITSSHWRWMHIYSHIACKNKTIQ